MPRVERNRLQFGRSSVVFQCVGTIRNHIDVPRHVALSVVPPVERRKIRPAHTLTARRVIVERNSQYRTMRWPADVHSAYRRFQPGLSAANPRPADKFPLDRSATLAPLLAQLRHVPRSVELPHRPLVHEQFIVGHAASSLDRVPPLFRTKSLRLRRFVAFHTATMHSEKDRDNAPVFLGFQKSAA